MTDPAKVRELIERLESTTGEYESGGTLNLLTEAATTLRDMLGQVEWRPISELRAYARVILVTQDADGIRYVLEGGKDANGYFYRSDGHLIEETPIGWRDIPTPPLEDA